MVFHRVDVENVRRDLLVDYATLEPDGPAGYDYTASSRTVVFRLNASSDTFVVPTLMDQVRDENEAFRVRLSNARLQTSGVGKEFADHEAVGTITDAMPIADRRRVQRRTEEARGRILSFEPRLSADLTSTAEQVENALTADGAKVAVAKQSARRWTITITPEIAGNISVRLDNTLLSGADGRPVEPGETVTIFGRSTVSISDVTGPESAQAMRFTARLDYAAEQTRVGGLRDRRRNRKTPPGLRGGQRQSEVRPGGD